MPLIYESPDKGDTVYAREAGTDNKVLVKKPSIRDQLADSRLWGNIHRSAAGNPALRKALDQCIIIYMLSKDYEERYGNKGQT